MNPRAIAFLEAAIAQRRRSRRVRCDARDWGEGTSRARIEGGQVGASKSESEDEVEQVSEKHRYNPGTVLDGEHRGSSSSSSGDSSSDGSSSTLGAIARGEQCG